MALPIEFFSINEIASLIALSTVKPSIDKVLSFEEFIIFASPFAVNAALDTSPPSTTSTIGRLYFDANSQSLSS